MIEVDILGTIYEIKFKKSRDDERLEDSDGYCDYTDKKIVIKLDNNFDVGDFNWLQRRSMRHEIIHAFMAESGLQSNWQHQEQWGHDETTVDWFAIQYPKISKVFKEMRIEE